MPVIPGPPPIAGTPIDPPPRGLPRYAEALDGTAAGGIAYRAVARYTFAHVGLLVSGTAYYLFLSLLSLLAVTYGVFAVVGADVLAALLTDALDAALPGLVGPEGIDPDQLRSTGSTAGIVGLLVLLYSGLGAIGAASHSLHAIYGAAPDPRSFVTSKARHLLLLALVAPLVAVSFGSISLTSGLGRPALAAMGWETTLTDEALLGIGLATGLVVDVLILWILLGRLGGIRPDRGPRLVSSISGAVAVAAIKQLLDVIVSWSLDKPQYGAFAAPLAILFILSLLTTVLYASAALAGGIADRHRPLAELQPTPDPRGTVGKHPVADHPGRDARGTRDPLGAPGGRQPPAARTRRRG